MKKHLWRMRFARYGQKKSKWGKRLWWEWSAAALDYCDLEDSPEEAAWDCITDAMA